MDKIDKGTSKVEMINKTEFPLTYFVLRRVRTVLGKLIT